MRRLTTVLGVPFDAVTMDEAVASIKQFLRQEHAHMVFTPNPEIVMEAQKDEELLRILCGADLVVPDGVGVVWASRYSEVRLRERVAGYDLTQNLFRELAETDETVYFFGGAPGIADTAANMMMKRYEGLNIVGVHDGFFDKEQEGHILADIRAKAPSLLLVGLGAPRQEKWIYEHLTEMNTKVAIGVGGSFDVMAGNIKRAPRVFQKLGLEWFYRLITQPTRWRRMMRLPRFVIVVLKNRK